MQDKKGIISTFLDLEFTGLASVFPYVTVDHVEVSPDIAKKNIVYIAKQLGFSDCRIAAATDATHADRFKEWIADGSAGDMTWLERNVDRRVSPTQVVPGAKAVVTLALNYFPGDQPDSDDYRIARYSWNDDYHDIIEEKLSDLHSAMTDMGGEQRYYVDTGPVLERDYATDAGLGWNGKSTVQIHPKIGTWFFLCELITTLPLEPDPPFGDKCGRCTRCIDHCPTQAITAPHKMDAQRCISYFTIEHKGAIPLEFRSMIGNRIYGCDVCLEVCPWNRFAQLSQESQLHARKEIFDLSLRDFLELDTEEFRRVFAKSPIKRIKRDRFLRNVCVAIGNTGTADDIARLERLASEECELVAEHARWAVTEILARSSNG